MRKIILRGPGILRHSNIVKWFYELYGSPQEWGGTVIGPEQLKKNFQWAYGNTDVIDSQTFEPFRAIWCGDKIYTMYLLRWK